MDFLHEVQFFAGIGPAHFPAVTTRPLGRGCLPFSPLYFRSKKTCRKYTLNNLNNQIDSKKTDASSRFSDVYLSYFMSCTGEAYRNCEHHKPRFSWTRPGSGFHPSQEGNCNSHRSEAFIVGDGGISPTDFLTMDIMRLFN
jgi:hypothetical protein